MAADWLLIGTRKYFGLIIVAVLILYPSVPAVDDVLFAITGTSFGSQITFLFVFALLALALNVAVGNAGLLHLGIAGFFGIGSYVTGILRVPFYPFQVNFLVAAVCASVIAGLVGFFLSAPLLRIRGDYLALVTLAFGEVVRFSIRNLEEITAGSRGLNPVQPLQHPEWVSNCLGWFGGGDIGATDYRPFYYVALSILIGVMILLRNLEKSPLGRAWTAVREDELAAASVGINVALAKRSAFVLAAALAGLAGCLYAIRLGSTAGPDAYDFNRSVIMLCCVVLGGMGNRVGTLLGVVVVVGFDNILAPILDGFTQRSIPNATGNPFLLFTNWRLMIFGLALILMMRFRPEGFIPQGTVREEYHEPKGGGI